jgi:hypothetical protein
MERGAAHGVGNAVLKCDAHEFHTVLPAKRFGEEAAYLLNNRALTSAWWVVDEGA